MTTAPKTRVNDAVVPLPCPSCNTPSEFLWDLPDGVRVICPMCDFQGPLLEDMNSAAREWNGVAELDGKLDDCRAELERVRQELEQERVQHAGCLTAAEGHKHERATRGMYGWSLAYQRTCELSDERDALRHRLSEAEAKCERLRAALDEALTDFEKQSMYEFCSCCGSAKGEGHIAVRISGGQTEIPCPTGAAIDRMRAALERP